MRYLLLSDIHANVVAFEAVLRHARLRRWDASVFLGDIVGYYPAAEAAVRLLRELDPEICIIGNHDALLLELADGRADEGGTEAKVVRDVLKRHLAELSADSLAFLRSFVTAVERPSWQATHGGLRRPWEYLTTLQSAQANAPFLTRELLFVGHTHVPRVFASLKTPSGELWRTVPFRGERSVYRMPPRASIIFNPGSVGQPRDGIPLAAYAIFDEEARTLEVFRVEYDLLSVQRSVREQHYPEVLASRLAVGK